MFDFLKIFKRSSKLKDVVDEAKERVVAPLSIDKTDELLDEEVPRYPPFTKGFPLFAADRILATQEELILRIKGIFSLSEEDFKRIVKPLIAAYADFVHLLPASEAHHHRGAGGLFRHGLEVAYWSVQVSDGYIFNSNF